MGLADTLKDDDDDDDDDIVIVVVFGVSAVGEGEEPEEDMVVSTVGRTRFGIDVGSGCLGRSGGGRGG